MKLTHSDTIPMRTFRIAPNRIAELLLPGRYGPQPDWENRCLVHPLPPVKIPCTCDGPRDDVPRKVLWADWADYAAALDHHLIFEGLGPGGEPELWDRSMDDPHAGLSAGTRRGKTNKLLVKAMQVLAKGGTVIAIDPKLVSFEALEGVPGALVYCDPWNVGAMWGALEMARKEIETRAKIRKRDKTARFTDLLVIVDEGNLYGELSKLQWKVDGHKGQPAMWDDLAMGLWTGAQFGVTFAYSGQRLDQRSTGNRGLRDSFGRRWSAGIPPNQVDMLYGPGEGRKITYPSLRGRFYLGQGMDRRWIQTPHVADPIRDVRDYVLSHRPSEHSGTGTVVARNQLCPAAAATRRAIGSTPIVGGLQPAADYLGIKYDTFRKARQRHEIEGEFRLGRSPAWTMATLDAWWSEYGNTQ
jgi:hypothetical protein